jgi:ABC-type multidrug transport system ATPase subunit
MSATVEAVPDPVQAATAKSTRLYFADHLRVALAVLVVLHHVAMVYGASAPFYYAEPPYDAPLAFLGFLIFALFNQAWFMGAFFLLSGYFTPGSFDRKGVGAFLEDRFRRLGIPLLLFFFILGPISGIGFYLMPSELTGITTPLTWDAYPYLFSLGPLWFVAMLLVFSVGYAVWRGLIKDRTLPSTRASSSPTYLGIGLFVLGLAAASYLMRMVVPLGKDVYGFPSLAYLPQYLSFFVVGIVANRRDWLRTLPSSMGVVGIVAALTASILLFPLAFSGRMFSLELTEALDNALGYGRTGHWRSAVHALWDSIFAVGLCLALIPLFRRWFGKRSGFGTFLSRQSYGVYIIHIPIIVFIAYALRNVALAPLPKFALVSAIVIPVCFAAAYVIQTVSRLLWGTGGKSAATAGARQANSGQALTSQNEIAIDGLVKVYGDVTAVNDLTLDIKKGELFGLLGPNGAGKTTTISILCGLLAPSAGSAQIGGHEVSTDMSLIKQRIGVCPQEAAVYEFLTGRENIELFGTLHGMDRRSARERTDALLDQADFAAAAGRRAKGYSGGMTRQLNLLMALVSDPEIVFLDEPTVGMDARARRRTWDYIASLKAQGKTIILTTHYIEEAESLSDRVGIIDYGELIDLGTPEELMQKHDAKDLEEVFLKITGRRIAEGS